MGIFYGSRKVTLRFNSGGEELARAVLGVPSVDCFFDKVLFSFDKRQSLCQQGIGEGDQ